MKWNKSKTTKQYCDTLIEIKGIGYFILYAYKIENENSFVYEIECPTEYISDFMNRFTKKKAKNLEEAKTLCEKAFIDYLSHINKQIIKIVK